MALRLSDTDHGCSGAVSGYMWRVYKNPRRRLDAPENMSHGSQKIDGKKRREPFISGWTGRITVALFVYVVAAILLTFVDGEGSRAYEIFTLYSDSPASIIAAILAGVAVEYIRWTANHLDSPFVQALIKPNLALQHLTTRTPDLSMLEVAIESFKSMRKAEQEAA